MGAEWEADNKLEYGGTSIAATEMKHKCFYTQKHVSEGYGGPHYACLFVYKYGQCRERCRFVLSPATAAAITKPVYFTIFKEYKTKNCRYLVN